MRTTSEQIVREFLLFLREHDGIVNTGNRTFDYRTLYDAIVDVIELVKQGCDEVEDCEINN